MNDIKRKRRILILGGGFAGVAAARRLERRFRRTADVEIVLASQDNFVVMTPLLFEVFSGTLDIRGCSLPARAFLHSTRFVEATVDSIDLVKRNVRLKSPGQSVELAYDQLVIALGGKTNRDMIPGAAHAFTFKTLADALLLRNHVIERFERADVESDPQRKSELLTFVIIGGGLVGVELLGELTTFVDGITPFYQHVDRGEVRFVLLQGADRILPEIDPALAAYGSQELTAQRGVELRTSTRVLAIEPRRVQLAEETIAADTIVLAAGAGPSPVVANLPIEKDKSADALWSNQPCAADAMRKCGHLATAPQFQAPTASRIPAWHSTHCARLRALADNIFEVLNGRPPKPFIYNMLGMMGALGRNTGFGQFLGVRLHGFPAWFIRRTYYLLQMPGWRRRLRIMIDWTFGLLFRPDIVKLGLDSETAFLLREVGMGEAITEGRGVGGAPTESANKGIPPAIAVPEMEWQRPTRVERAAT